MKKQIAAKLREWAEGLYPESSPILPDFQIPVVQIHYDMKRIAASVDVDEREKRRMQQIADSGGYSMKHQKAEIRHMNEKKITEAIFDMLKQNESIEFNTDPETLTTVGSLYVGVKHC